MSLRVFSAMWQRVVPTNLREALLFSVFLCAKIIIFFVFAKNSTIFFALFACFFWKRKKCFTT